MLTEARVVLPGVQALLGFQLAATLVDAFERLPESSKHLHLAGLRCLAIATVLLITPAAYHRPSGGGAPGARALPRVGEPLHRRRDGAAVRADLRPPQS